jgi:hypothetical protein
MTDRPTTLKDLLERIVARRRRLAFWSSLAVCWAGAAFIGLFVAFIERQSGWGSSLAMPLVGLIGIAGAIIVLFRFARARIDLRALAQQIEARYPDLEGRLLTAVQQPLDEAGLNYLQHRLLEETFARSQQSDWAKMIPRSRILIAQTAHWVALIFLGTVLWGLRLTSGPGLVARIGESGITVTPGDTSIERGNSLVVFVKFAGALPANVGLVTTAPGGTAQRVPLVKSLADPIFGGSVTEVSSNFTYHVEHGGQRTRDFAVTVFEYPRLDRADLEVKFPAYTGLPSKRIENTKRLSAVEGSTVDLALQLNKPVRSAALVPKDKTGSLISLSADTNRAIALLNGLPLEKSHSYDLRLIDAEGRTNKVPALFVFDVLTNRAPEFRLASPKGDIRPSPLEEITFEGTVWDDFGLKAYGLGYAIPGQETKFIELGKDVPAKEKMTFQYTLRLEDLKLEPDQLISWFVWADDAAPDGQTRRTAGDLFFGEVRPFDEIFREGLGMDGGQGGQQGQQGGQSPAAKLTELQKQIISATWRLRRENNAPSKQTSTPPKPQPVEPAPARESRNASPAALTEMAEFRNGWQSSQAPVQKVFGQTSDSQSQSERPTARSRRDSSSAGSTAGASGSHSYSDDATVVRDSQAQALDQVEEMSGRTQDPRALALWTAAKKEMQKALENLEKAKGSPATLPDALAAEQAAYQALLRLQQHEYQVMRNQRNQQGGGGSSRERQMQRQLDQLDLKQADNRYETQRQAQRQQTTERREQLQVQNRLQELARRQQDLNDRLKELQTALQEAKTEQEREEIRRRLKRLQEEEQQMLNDVDELRQRMDRPENQSRMAEERKQLEDTRKDVQQAADAANQGQASQALASGTRAQRKLQQLRDQMRKENSSQFADDLRQMRNEARELTRQQEDILKKLEADSAARDRSLSDSTNRQEALNELTQQKQRMTNLVDRATQISQEAEDAEPVVSRQLYDSVRKFAQDSSKAVQETQDELLSRGLMTRNVYDTLQNKAETDGPKLLEATSELVKQDLVKPASQAGERTRSSLGTLKKGVERAAESVLGDDTEALRLAQQEIDQLTDQLQREMNQGRGVGNQTNQTGGVAQQGNSSSGTNNVAGASGSRTNLAANSQGNNSQSAANRSGRNRGNSESPEQAQNSSQSNRGEHQDGEQQNSSQANNQPSDQQQSQGSQPGGSQNRNGQRNSEQAANQQGQQGSTGQQPSNEHTSNNASESENAGSQAANSGQRAGGQRQGGARNNNDNGGAGGWDLNRSLDRMFDNNYGGNYAGGPLTGENFMDWSDRLRDVEEIVDDPAWRNQVARARERARLLRQEFKRDLKKPDWAVVQLQIMNPLIEVRNRIADELARRENSDSLVPIDRDPVPNRYSDLVRRYYEELGKDK